MGHKERVCAHKTSQGPLEQQKLIRERDGAAGSAKGQHDNPLEATGQQTDLATCTAV